MILRACCFVSAFQLIAAWMLFDYGIRFPNLFQKYPPEGGPIGLFKAVTVSFAAFSAAMAFWSPPGTAERRDVHARAPSFSLAIAGSYALLAFPVVMLMRDPATVQTALGEFSAVEAGSAALLGGAVVLLVLASLADPQDRIGLWTHRLIVLTMALVIFLTMMEEISWAQHYLGYETPAFLTDNDQREANFHNFYTWHFENAYYSAAVLAFVAIPFFWSDRALARTRLGLYVPPPSFALLALPVGGMTWEMWNVPNIQFGFFLCVVVGLLFLRIPGTCAARRRLAIFAVACLIFSQGIFLATGHMLTQTNALTEFKELLIAFLVFAYAIWLFSTLYDARVERTAPRAAVARNNLSAGAELRQESRNRIGLDAVRGLRSRPDQQERSQR